MSDPNSLVKTLRGVADAIENGPSLDDERRMELYQTCERIRGHLETPIQKINGYIFGFSEVCALRASVDMGIFDIDDPAFEDRGLTVAEIASHTGTDPVLVGRMMRSLALTGFFDVLPSGTYKATPSFRQFGPDDYPQIQLKVFYDCLVPCLGKLPEYLEKHGHQSPSDITAGVWQYAFNTNQDAFEWLSHHPEKQTLFARYMQETLTKRMKGNGWSDLFPVAERYTQLYCSDETTEVLRFVDVGGSIGSQIKILLDRLPNIRAHFHLQDRADVVKQVIPELRALSDDPAVKVQVELMPHNFYEEQPVRGADVYLLARVMHDWPDRESKKILSRIHDAMEPNSTLLIFDRVLPDTPTKLEREVVVVDLLMMACQSALERTEGEFRELVSSVGLEVVRVWRQEDSPSQLGVLEIKKRS